MRTLKLFNAVKSIPVSGMSPHISDEGIIIEPGALWAKDRIIDYYRHERLNGNDLNKTFHKSWAKIKNSSRLELLIHQIMHYISTYGSDFKDEMYIPDEVLSIPDVELKYKVIRALTVEEITEKCLDMLRSGIALAEDTLDDVITLLGDELKYEFTGAEKFRNREAVVRIADLYNVFPDNPVEFLRYMIFKSTGKTLLIKNEATTQAIIDSSYNPMMAIRKYGEWRLAEIFNRFKPIFMAYKKRCPATINRISKLSKKHHKPLMGHPLNQATTHELIEEHLKSIEQSSIFMVLRAYQSIQNNLNGKSNFFYKIRNGKAWVTDQNKKRDVVLWAHNSDFLVKHLLQRLNFNNIKIYFPNDIDYALPTSEKMFVGNIPTGTRFYGEKLAVGIYWENNWGASDLDLSALNIGGKVGWNSRYSQEGDLMFSGDITDAPNGAVEYLYANQGLTHPSIVLNNVYYGDNNCQYKIIVGRGSGIDYDYMMDPNNLFIQVQCKSVMKQTVLGIFLPDPEHKKKQCFTLLNSALGNFTISTGNNRSMIAIKALVEDYSDPLNFRDLFIMCNGQSVVDKEQADIDLSVDALEKDTFTRLLTGQFKS